MRNDSIGREFRSGQSITGFRDHHLSDLIAFVYSRNGCKGRWLRLHGRLRFLGERVSGTGPLTISLFLDGWKMLGSITLATAVIFCGNFNGKIQGDPDFTAMTVSEAIAARNKFRKTTASSRVVD